MKKKISIVGIILVMIMFSLFGGTLAYLSWQTSSEQKTEVVYTLTPGYQCAVDGGGDITSEHVKLAPSSCMNTNHAIIRKVISSVVVEESNVDVNMNLWIKVNQIDSGLSNSQNFKYALTTSKNSCTEGVVARGSFNGSRTNSQITILNDNFTITTVDEYYLYIWLDAAETSMSTINQQFDLSLGGICNAEKDAVLVTGTPMVGSILSAALNIETGETSPTYTYQWYSNDTPTPVNGQVISGATGSTYTIGSGLQGKYIYVVVTNSQGKTYSGVTKDFVTVDSVAPSATIGNLSGTTVVLNYSDSVGVTKYYFGTSNPETSTVTWTDINSTTLGSVSGTVSSAGKYYFAVQDGAGNSGNSSFDLAVGTFYYYSGSAQTSTVDRCIIYSGSSSCDFTLPSAVTSSTGPSSASYHGVSTSTSSSTVTTSYTSANSKYYAVYKGSWKATYAKGTGVSTIGATSKSCTNYKRTNGTTYSSTSCSVTLPAITAADNYNVLGWYNSSNTKVGNAGASLSLSANGTYTAKAEVKQFYSESILNGADPVLSSGLIPVSLSSGSEAQTANLYNQWYDYETKQWANAVLVSNSARSKYYESDGTTIKSGVTVPETDILAYFVWIPSYSYKMNGRQQSISISFNNTPSGYIKHPAFNFDGDKPGFWVGKFETSVVNDAALNGVLDELGCVNENCSAADTLRIKPHVYPRTREKVSEYFYAARSIERNGNSFGLVSSEVDTHMMKNSEWGAVAYLSHSVYGKNGLMYYNRNLYYTTGCGGGCSTCGELYSTSCEFPYNTQYSSLGISFNHSTTGNITGVFDMSGGVTEVMMSVLSDLNGEPRSGYDWYSNSGFNGTIYVSVVYDEEYEEEVEYYDEYWSDGIDFPSTKYYDLFEYIYEYDEDLEEEVIAGMLCNGGSCNGHAYSETHYWYFDDWNVVEEDEQEYFTKVYDMSPWVTRGGIAQGGRFTSIFNYSADSGSGGSSFRVVLTAID